MTRAEPWSEGSRATTSPLLTKEREGLVASPGKEAGRLSMSPRAPLRQSTQERVGFFLLEVNIGSEVGSEIG